MRPGGSSAHNVTNVRFETVTPSEAVVASYFTVFTEVGPDHMGRYRDRLVPVGDRWLIAHRFVSVDWHSPDSTFGSGEGQLTACSGRGQQPRRWRRR